MVFPILSPDPSKNKNISYLKYPIYVGGNRGRGQIYADGSKSNNTIYTSSIDGKIVDILPIEKTGGYEVIIEKKSGEQIVETIPPGPELIISKNDIVKVDQPLTNNPNVGDLAKVKQKLFYKSSSNSRIVSLFYFYTFITNIFSFEEKTI